jgi:hypothetical protein
MEFCSTALLKNTRVRVGDLDSGFGFVPKGLNDGILARSAWKASEIGSVP